MEITVEEYNLRIQIVRPTGRIIATTAPALKDATRGLIKTQLCKIILDLREVEFIDSIGLGALASILHASLACGGDLILVLPKKSAVYAILTVVRFNEVFAIYETLPEAFRHFS